MDSYLHKFNKSLISGDQVERVSFVFSILFTEVYFTELLITELSQIA